MSLPRADYTLVVFVYANTLTGNLDALLRKEGTLSEIQSKFYGAEMLMAINVLHRHGYMHRNIQLDVFLVDVTVCMCSVTLCVFVTWCVFVCACVWRRERER